MTYSIIMLHGLGADGSDMQPVAEFLAQALQKQQPQSQVRVHCPDAPARPVTVNGGYIMPAWFDLYGLNADAPSDTQGIAQSVQRIQTLLHAEHAAGIPWQNIILGGFSQGGVIAMHSALTLGAALGGLLALSTWLPAVESLTPNAEIGLTPVFIGHGEDDDLIPISAATRTRDSLARLGYRRIEQHSYPMPHSMSMEELEEMARWINQHLTH